MDSQATLDFWFNELTSKQWWVTDPSVDELIRTRFLDTHAAASCGELDNWRSTPEGRLAEIIVLDQFSRNLHRASGRAFAWDPMALVLSQEAIRCGADQELSQQQRSFLYMPFMHSESAAIHERAVELFQDLPGNYEFELKHKAIIDRFGRYPHRNESLGRTSTAEELEFLKEPGSSF